MMQRQTTIERIVFHLHTMGDRALEALLLGLQVGKLQHDPDAPTSVDGYPYIRYGKDETEHLMASVANAERLNRAIEDLELGLEQPVVLTLEAFRSLVNEC